MSHALKDAVRNARAFTLLDVLATIAIFGVVMAVALPHVNLARLALPRSARTLADDLRNARFRAITSGDHFLLRTTGERTYELIRMEDDGHGNWTAMDSGRTRQVTMPGAVSLSSSAVPGGGDLAIEFNTRGMVLHHNEPVTIVLADVYGASRSVTVWPSGQVYVSRDAQAG